MQRDLMSSDRGGARRTPGGPRRLLLVDDDIDLGALMVEYLSARGYAVDVAPDGADGLQRTLDDHYDLVILDVMLPTVDGFEILRQLRERSDVPVIMLTARASESDRLNGLGAGADDYQTKPFSPAELVARIEAVIRRTEHTRRSTPPVVEVGRFRIDTTTRQVWREQVPIELTSIEFDILVVLAHATGRIVSRNEIVAMLHHRPATPYERAVDVHISHLRRKLDASRGTVITTIRGVGYSFADKR